MDVYPGYNQIPMYLADKEHTSFITYRGLYCYKVMPFRLKNVKTTYQILVNKMFTDLIRRTVDMYVDDMLVKSLKVDHIWQLEKVFQTLRRYKMQLNPFKCVFRIASRMFLGYMVNQRSIEANPNKIKALIEMRSP